MPIHIVSIQHTGTWFVAEKLKAHPDAGDIVVQRNAPDGLSHVSTNDVIVSHLHGPPGSQITTKVRFFPETAKLAEYCKVVIPVRDPIDALITRQIRHPDLSHAYIIEAFVRLPELEGAATFFPVDRQPSESARRFSVIKLYQQCGLSIPSNVNEIAEDWSPPAYNVTPPDDPLKIWRRDENYAEIAKAMPDEWALLMDNKEVIQSWMSKTFGYRFTW